MFRKMMVGVAVAVAALAGAPAALASGHDQLAVQLNVDAGRVNVFQWTEGNTAFGNCPNGKGVFSSPTLVFSNYKYGPTNHFDGNVSATATFKPGMGWPGTSPLFMTCGDKQIDAVITVPSPPTTTTTTPPPPVNHPFVQLNTDTAAIFEKNVYQFAHSNWANGYCPDHVVVFSSSVLTFGDNQYNPYEMHNLNVSAPATLKPGVGAGTYKLSMTCDGQTVSTDFLVPAKQVTKTPVGAPQTGGGGTATVVE
jgi:hypothetical protein